LIGIVPSTTEAECFLCRESIQRPSLCLKTTIIDRIDCHLFDKKRVVVRPSLTEEGIDILATRKSYTILCHIIKLLLVWLCASKKSPSPKHGFGLKRLATSQDLCFPIADVNLTPRLFFYIGRYPIRCFG